MSRVRPFLPLLIIARCMFLILLFQRMPFCQTSDFTAYYRPGHIIATEQGAQIYDYAAAKNHSPRRKAELVAMHGHLALKRVVSASRRSVTPLPTGFRYRAPFFWPGPERLIVCLFSGAPAFAAERFVETVGPFRRERPALARSVFAKPTGS